MQHESNLLSYAPLAPVISRCISSAGPLRLLLSRLILLGLMRIGSELWKVTGAMIRNLFPDLYISPFASPLQYFMRQCAASRGAVLCTLNYDGQSIPLRSCDPDTQMCQYAKTFSVNPI